jgi:glyoxylase-like metal-dependent hydrolase (beta-lactamase superfamily II)
MTDVSPASVPQIEAFFDEATATVSYLVWDQATRQAAVIDPVLDYDPKSATVSSGSSDALIAAANARNLTLAYVLETHAHADHLSGASHIRERTGARIAIGARITEVQRAFAPLFHARDVKPDGRVFDLLLGDGATVALGGLEIEVIATPGHTPACVSYRIADAVFVGDTLFMPDFGTARTDFPGGSAATLYQSIQRLLSLPPQTRMFVGHDYLPAGRMAFAWETTVAEQRARNVHVGSGRSEAEFVTLRQARDATLAAPVLILPSLQVNIRAGQLPPAEDDGTIYLRLPVNRLGGGASQAA